HVFFLFFVEFLLFRRKQLKETSKEGRARETFPFPLSFRGNRNTCTVFLSGQRSSSRDESLCCGFTQHFFSLLASDCLTGANMTALQDQRRSHHLLPSGSAETRSDVYVKPEAETLMDVKQWLT
uniref:Uncharacterized protein n=1 Tax=Poecilia reticulata TaxID=8081 RepID=A0A3P9PT31_POERE